MLVKTMVMKSRKNNFRVIRSSEAVIEEFMRKERSIEHLAKYYWLKVNFTSSFLHSDLGRAAQRLDVSRRTMERTVNVLLAQKLVERSRGGYRLISKRELDENFVAVLQKKRLLHSCTLCFQEGATWKDFKDQLQLKLLQQHARNTYFWARKNGKLHTIVGSTGQRTERIDWALNRAKDGESLGIYIPMKSICNLFSSTEKTVKSWRERMVHSGFIWTTKSFQFVTQIGDTYLGPLTPRAFEALRAAQPKEFSNHCFLTKNGTIIKRNPLIFEFLTHPVYHKTPRRQVKTL